MKVLKNLEKTYCRLKISKIDGIGVFAIRDIPKNTNPFYGCIKHKWYNLKLSELRGLDPEVMKMVYDFYAFEDDETIVIPSCGFNGMDISFFLNQSKKPNVRLVDDGPNFITTKNIKKDEELSVSYSDFDHRYKEK